MDEVFVLGAVVQKDLKLWVVSTSPTSKSELFSTAADGQTSEEINVYQGERGVFISLKKGGERVCEGLVLAQCQVMGWIGWLKKLKILQKEDQGKEGCHRHKESS